MLRKRFKILKFYWFFSQSIKRATDNMVNGRIFLSRTTILNVNINRSPTSYLRNPVEERAQYEHDVDKVLTQLRLVDSENNLLGAFNWYAVHATSMNNTNKLVTSDNMGYAALLLEKEYNTNKVPGKVSFSFYDCFIWLIFSKTVLVQNQCCKSIKIFYVYSKVQP